MGTSIERRVLRVPSLCVLCEPSDCTVRVHKRTRRENTRSTQKFERLKNEKQNHNYLFYSILPD